MQDLLVEILVLDPYPTTAVLSAAIQGSYNLSASQGKMAATSLLACLSHVRMGNGKRTAVGVKRVADVLDRVLKLPKRVAEEKAPAGNSEDTLVNVRSGKLSWPAVFFRRQGSNYRRQQQSCNCASAS